MDTISFRNESPSSRRHFMLFGVHTMMSRGKRGQDRPVCSMAPNGKLDESLALGSREEPAASSKGPYVLGRLPSPRK
jgi:hypothetical protein